MDYILISMLLLVIAGIYSLFRQLDKKYETIDSLEHEVKAQNYVYRALIKHYKTVGAADQDHVVMGFFRDELNALSHDSRQNMIRIAEEVIK